LRDSPRSFNKENFSYLPFPPPGSASRECPSLFRRFLNCAPSDIFHSYCRRLSRWVFTISSPRWRAGPLSLVALSTASLPSIAVFFFFFFSEILPPFLLPMRAVGFVSSVHFPEAGHSLFHSLRVPRCSQVLLVQGILSCLLLS